jgi:uncharacterized membrane protein YoaT (DUF817 family)
VSQEYKNKVREKSRQRVLSVGGAVIGFFVFMAAAIAGLVSMLGGD